MTMAIKPAILAVKIVSDSWLLKKSIRKVIARKRAVLRITLLV